MLTIRVPQRGKVMTMTALLGNESDLPSEKARMGEPGSAEAAWVCCRTNPLSHDSATTLSPSFELGLGESFRPVESQ